MISSDELETTAKLAKAATPGPWYFDESCDVFAGKFDPEKGFEKRVCGMHYNPKYHPDLEFIAHMHPIRALGMIEKIRDLQDLHEEKCERILQLEGDLRHSVEEIARLTRVNESHMTMWNQAEDELKRARELLGKAEKAFEIISNMGTQSRDGHKINGHWTIAKEMLEKIKAARGEK
jgi:hypothetical protein